MLTRLAIATTCQIEYKNEGSTTPSGLGGANTTGPCQIRLGSEEHPSPFKPIDDDYLPPVLGPRTDLS